MSETNELGVKNPIWNQLGFELIVGPPSGIVDNADIPVRWCITPEGVKLLCNLHLLKT